MNVNNPDFLIIGAQKAGTTWLWAMLKQHPGTSLPETKELHYYGSAELYRKGPESYYQHFAALDSNKVIGEASTTYLYDRVPYWYNKSNEIEFDDSLPLLPELIKQDLPDIKILVVLRDPVRRAVSAYSHYTQTGQLSPFSSLKQTALECPKYRLLEYGFYHKYLSVWQDVYPKERFKVLVFEEDVIKYPDTTIKDVYNFLDLDPEFKPSASDKKRNKSKSWTRIVVSHILGKVSPSLSTSRIPRMFDRLDFLKNRAYSNADIEFLAQEYLSEKKSLEILLGRS